MKTHTHVSAILHLASSEPAPSFPHGSLYSQHCGTAPGFVFLPRCWGAVGQKLIQIDAPDAASVCQRRRNKKSSMHALRTTRHIKDKSIGKRCDRLRHTCDDMMQLQKRGRPLGRDITSMPINAQLDSIPMSTNRHPDRSEHVPDHDWPILRQCLAPPTTAVAFRKEFYCSCSGSKWTAKTTADSALKGTKGIWLCTNYLKDLHSFFYKWPLRSVAHTRHEDFLDFPFQYEFVLAKSDNLVVLNLLCPCCFKHLSGTGPAAR